MLKPEMKILTKHKDKHDDIFQLIFEVIFTFHVSFFFLGGEAEPFSAPFSGLGVDEVP